MEPAASLNGQLFHLRQRFVQRMPDRIAAIAAALDECVDGGAEAMERLQRQFHSLAGTAGTYDLTAVSAAAFEGEEACAELESSPLDADGLAYLIFLVDQLRSALASGAPADWIARTTLTATRSGTSTARKEVSVA